MNRWSSRFFKFLPEIFLPEEDRHIFSPPNYSSDLIKKEIESWEYLYINISFFMHFSIYAWFFLESFRNVPHFPLFTLGVTALNVFIYFIYLKKFSRFLNPIIFLYNFIILAIYHRLTYLSYFYGSNNIDLVVASLSIGSIIIMLQAFRLRKSAAFYVGLSSILLYFTTIAIFYKVDGLTISAEAVLIPIFFFILSTVIATFIILSSNKVVQKSNYLSFQKEVIDHDLGLAKKVQDSLFPEKNEINGLKYIVFRKNQQVVGGDFFDFVQLREGNVGVFLTDVAGHGISSAMVAAILKVLVSNMPYRLKLNPSGFLDYLDSKLYHDFGTHHASAVYMFFDFLGKQVYYGNAGHPYPLYSENGEEFKEILTEGSILGYRIKSPIAKSVNFPMIKGSRFFLFTDGLLETANSKGNVLDINTLISLLNQNRSIKDISNFQEAIKSKIDSFFQGVSFSDDTMYLILELT